MLNVERQNDKLICTFSGRIDTAKTGEVEKILMEKTKDQDCPMVFDMKGVDYVSSSFLRICLRMAKERGKERFLIINLTPMVEKVFMIAGFDKLLPIE